MKRVKKYLKALKRRADFLRERIAKSPDDLSFDKAELAALDWATKSLSEAHKETHRQENECRFWAQREV